MMQAGVIYKCDRALPEACEYDNGSNKRYKWCCISSSVQLFQGWQVSCLEKKNKTKSEIKVVNIPNKQYVKLKFQHIYISLYVNI